MLHSYEGDVTDIMTCDGEPSSSSKSSSIIPSDPKAAFGSRSSNPASGRHDDSINKLEIIN